MIHTPLRTAAILALAMALSGCLGLGGGKPPAQFYTLTPDAPPAPGSGASAPATASGPAVLPVPGTGVAAVIPAPASPSVIVVSEPTTAHALAVNRVPVQEDATRIAYLKDAVWAERPAALFRSLLVETLRRDDNRVVIADDDPAARGGLKLSGELLAMGYDAPAHGVVVRFEALRSTPRGDVASRRFEATESDVPANGPAVAAALNRAANHVAHDVAAWMQ